MRALASLFIYSILFLIIFISLGAFKKHDFSALHNQAEAAPRVAALSASDAALTTDLPQNQEVISNFCRQSQSLSLSPAACPDASAAQDAALALYRLLSRENAQALQTQIDQEKAAFAAQQQSRLAALAAIEKKLALNASQQAQLTRLKQQQAAFEAEQKTLQAIQAQERARRLEQQLAAASLNADVSAFYAELRTWNYPGSVDLAVDNDRENLRAWLDTPFNRFADDQALLTQALQNGDFTSLDSAEGNEIFILQQLKKLTFQPARNYQLPELQAAVKNFFG